jgi:hypothetical protein
MGWTPPTARRASDREMGGRYPQRRLEGSLLAQRVQLEEPLRQANCGGADGLSCPKRRYRPFTPDHKAEIVLAGLRGMGGA